MIENCPLKFLKQLLFSHPARQQIPRARRREQEKESTDVQGIRGQRRVGKEEEIHKVEGKDKGTEQKEEEEEQGDNDLKNEKGNYFMKY